MLVYINNKETNMNKLLKEWGSILGQTAIIVAIVLLSILPASCRVTAEGIHIIGGDYTAPVLERVSVVDGQTLEVAFSEAVTITDVVISPQIEDLSNSEIHSKNVNLSAALASASGANGRLDVEMHQSEDGKLFTFNFVEPTKVGKTYEIFGRVHDSIGNSLVFCVPFTGFNSKVAKIIMTEAQVKYTKATLKTGTVYRSEFVVLFALTDGNLAGIELVSASDGEDKKYVFPAIDVKKGQTFVVHLRTAGEGCVNETDDFNAATAEYSNPGILDLWSENTTARFNDATDIIFLRNTVDDTIMDGVMYAAEEAEEWKPAVAEVAAQLVAAGIYDSAEIVNATCSKGLSPKKSLQRVNAGAIKAAVENEEEVEWPVMSDGGSWKVGEGVAIVN